MEAIFQSYHPKKGIRPGRGLISQLFILFKQRFPHYLDPVLHLICKVLTRFRIRALNVIAKKKNRKKGEKKRKGEVTPRGRRVKSDFSTG